MMVLGAVFMTIFFGFVRDVLIKKETTKEVKKEEKTETEDLSSKTLAELKAIAKEKGIKGYSTMKKDELLSNLK